MREIQMAHRPDARNAVDSFALGNKGFCASPRLEFHRPRSDSNRRITDLQFNRTSTTKENFGTYTQMGRLPFTRRKENRKLSPKKSLRSDLGNAKECGGNQQYDDSRKRNCKKPQQENNQWSSVLAPMLIRPTQNQHDRDQYHHAD